MVFVMDMVLLADRLLVLKGLSGFSMDADKGEAESLESGLSFCKKPCWC